MNQRCCGICPLTCAGSSLVCLVIHCQSLMGSESDLWWQWWTVPSRELMGRHWWHWVGFCGMVVAVVEVLVDMWKHTCTRNMQARIMHETEIRSVCMWWALQVPSEALRGRGVQQACLLWLANVAPGGDHCLLFYASPYWSRVVSCFHTTTQLCRV